MRARQDNSFLTVEDAPESSHEPGVTVVIPCLNERTTIAEAVVQAHRDADAERAGGTRLQGQIEPGAMPVLHRRLGPPVLTAMINLLFGSRLTDCNSGFRAFRRDQLTTWEVSSPGMEFASELLVNALRAGAKIVEVPITLRRDH